MPYRDRWPKEFEHVARVNDRRLFAVKANPNRGHSEPFTLVLESRDNGRTWRPIPLWRTIGAYIYQHAHFDHCEWPPVSFIEFEWEAPYLRGRYEDFEWDAAGGYIWDAFYSPVRRRWTLKKVRRVYWDDE